MLLAIDTSNAVCSAALLSADGSCLAQKSENIGRGHAERLMPMIEEILVSMGCAWTDIERLAVVIGPGSFTGLRVGLAAARGLALASSVPLHGVTAFEAFALHHGDGTPITVALDARRDEIWTQSFDEFGNAMSEPAACSIEDAVETLTPKSRIVGSGGPVLVTAGANIHCIDDAPSPPILAVGHCALAQKTPQAADPLYLRAPDAKPQMPVTA